MSNSYGFNAYSILNEAKKEIYFLEIYLAKYQYPDVITEMIADFRMQLALQDFKFHCFSSYGLSNEIQINPYQGIASRIRLFNIMVSSAQNVDDLPLIINSGIPDFITFKVAINYNILMYHRKKRNFAKVIRVYLRVFKDQKNIKNTIKLAKISGSTFEKALFLFQPSRN